MLLFARNSVVYFSFLLWFGSETNFLRTLTSTKPTVQLYFIARKICYRHQRLLVPRVQNVSRSLLLDCWRFQHKAPHDSYKLSRPPPDVRHPEHTIKLTLAIWKQKFDAQYDQTHHFLVGCLTLGPHFFFLAFRQHTIGDVLNFT